MEDPFLSKHAYAPGVWSLAERSPLAFRDQMMRAHFLVDRLFETGRVGAGDSFVVVGAGVAGISAAILAAYNGANVTIVDSRQIAFSLQHNCRSRWIDPVQYDWPANHSDCAQWPITGFDIRAPLGFRANFINAIVKEWRSAFDIARAARGNLRRIMPAKLLTFPAISSKGNFLEFYVEDLSSSTIKQLDASAVAWCTGIVREKLEAPLPSHLPLHRTPTSGPAFWSTDEFTKTSLGITGYSITNPIFISGSGDGALQDFLRLVTGKESPIEFFSQNSTQSAFDCIPSEVVSLISNAEQHARLHLSWATSNHQRHAILDLLQQSHIAAVETWQCFHKQSWLDLRTKFETHVANRPIGHIKLLCTCSHFSDCYALNRFTSILVARLVTEIFQSVGVELHPILYGTRLSSASAVNAFPPHRCGNNCWGNKHAVSLMQSCTCTQDGNEEPEVLADGLVVRHGIEPTPVGHDALPLNF